MFFMAPMWCYVHYVSKSSKIHCNLKWVSYNLASLRQVGETQEPGITLFLASFILVAVRLELDRLFHCGLFVSLGPRLV